MKVKINRVRIIVVGLLAANTFLLAYSSLQHSPNWDEIGHLPAGLSHYRLGNFELYKVNPPGVRLLAALPVLFAGPECDWTVGPKVAGSRYDFEVGLRFLELNGMRSFWLFGLARWGCIPFSWLGGVMCFLWARRLYGERSGLAAITLWCFSPAVLAYGQMITPSIGSAAMGMLGNYLFLKWLEKFTWQRAFLAGAGLGLALLTKTTWLILFGLWPILWAVHVWRPEQKMTGRSLRQQTSQMLVVFLVSLYILNGVYLFEGSFRPLGSFEFVSEALAGEYDAGMHYGNRFRSTVLGHIPVPFPENFIEGIDYLSKEFDEKMWSYLNGEWRLGGWWYFYLFAMLIKVPVGTLGLFLLGLGAWLLKPNRNGWRDELVLMLPCFCVLVLVSSQTGFNHHLRYVMPAFPAMFVLASRVFHCVNVSQAVRKITYCALLWSTISSLCIWPHSRSYFNELIGGPRNGHWYMGGSFIDTNIDCGQDLLYLKKWISEHDVSPLYLSFNGAMRPEIAGINCPDVSVGPLPGTTASGCKPSNGWYVISVNHLHDPDGHHRYFLTQTPVDRIGYSMNIYYVTGD